MSNNLENNNILFRWLEGTLTDEERTQLSNDYPELDALKVAITDVDTWKVKDFDTDLGLAQLQELKKTTVTKSKPYKSWLSIAASLLVFVSSYFLWNYFDDQVVIKTLASEQKNVTLPDGSVVKLDEASELRYSKKDWQKHRELRLLGQGYFDVKKGSTFKVETTNAIVEVLGTQFNINTAKQKTKVTCFEGRVSVSFRNKKEILSAGEALIISPEAYLRSNHKDKKPKWLQEYLYYDNASLINITKDLEEVFGVSIELPKQYETLKFTGKLPTKDLSLALKNVLQPLELNFQFVNSNKVLVN